jgi:hypothetical protein
MEILEFVCSPKASFFLDLQPPEIMEIFEFVWRSKASFFGFATASRIRVL